ncbi:MAG TPA: hypothetical protein VGD56_05005, partial [Gemmatirosa sp.]
MRCPPSAVATALLAALHAPRADAAAQIVAGRVVADGTRQPLAGLRVRVLRATPAGVAATADTTPVGEAITAADGVFSVFLPKPGVYQVRIAETFVAPPVALLNPDSTDSREYVMPPADVATRESNGPPDADVDALLRAGVPFHPTQVDQIACLRTTNEQPPYPRTMARLGVSGSFGTYFVVDTVGRIDVRTLRVLNPTEPEFVEAVRDWLRGLR